jgi:histone H3/H4
MCNCENILKEMIDEYNSMIPSDALETLQEALSRITKK